MLACAAVLLFAALVATGCGGSADDANAAGAPKLSFITGRDPSGFNDRIVADCNKRAKGKYEIVQVPMPPSVDAAREQLTRRLAAGDTSIDLVNLDVVWIAEFSDAGWLVDLTDRVEPQKDLYIDKALGSAFYKGKYWAVPVVTNAALLYYRSDIVKDAPTSLEDVVEDVKAAKATHPDMGGFVFQGAPYEGGTVDALEFIYGADGQVLSEDGSKSVITEGDEVVKAFTFLKMLFDDGIAPKAVTTYMEEDARQSFMNGGAVFMRNWPYAMPLMNADDSPVKGKFKVMPLPGFADGRPASVLGGANYGISAFSPNKEESWDAIECMNSADVQRQRLIEKGDIPTIRSIYLEPDMQAKVPYLKASLPAVESGNIRPVTPYYNDVTGVIYRAYSDVLNGHISPEDAAARMDSGVQKAIDGKADI